MYIYKCNISQALNVIDRLEAAGTPAVGKTRSKILTVAKKLNKKRSAVAAT
jgi:hypothetical protein